MASAAAKRLQRRVRRFARSLEPELARRILRAYEVIRTLLREDEIAALLRLGAGADRVVTELAGFEELNRMLVSEVGPTLSRGTINAGAAFSIDLPTRLARDAVRGGLNLLNPRVIDGLAQVQSRVFLRLSIGAQESFRQALQRGLEAGTGHGPIAREARKVIGLNPANERAVANFERMLREGDRGALTRSLRDRRFDGTLRRALGARGTGLSESQIERMVNAHRRKTISSNASLQSRSAALDATRRGQRLSFEDAIGKGVTKREETWKRRHDAGDRRVRPEHVEINLEERQFDEPYSNGEIVAGDASVACRCADEYFTRRLSTAIA